MSDRMIPVTVQIPAKVFWQVGQNASKVGKRIPDYLVDLMLATITRVPDGLDDPVMVRWLRGWPDKEIARDLGVTNLRVATRRRQFRKPANSLAAWNAQKEAA